MEKIFLVAGVERTGLDTYLGFLHEVKYGKPSLALDFLEQFRAVMDLLVLKSINLKIIEPGEFTAKNIFPNQILSRNFKRNAEIKV